MLAVQPYDFELKYIPAHDAVVANTLSRTYLEDTNSEISQTDMATYMHMIIKNYPMSDDKLNSYIEATERTQHYKYWLNVQRKSCPQKKKYYSTFKPLAPLGTNWQSSKNLS